MPKKVKKHSKPDARSKKNSKTVVRLSGENPVTREELESLSPRTVAERAAEELRFTTPLDQVVVLTYSKADNCYDFGSSGSTPEARAAARRFEKAMKAYLEGEAVLVKKEPEALAEPPKPKITTSSGEF